MVWLYTFLGFCQWYESPVIKLLANAVFYVRTEFETKSTYGKEGEEMRLQVDPLSHPAYTGRRRELDTEGRVDKFRNRYGMKK